MRGVEARKFQVKRGGGYEEGAGYYLYRWSFERSLGFRSNNETAIAFPRGPDLHEGILVVIGKIRMVLWSSVQAGGMAR